MSHMRILLQVIKYINYGIFLIIKIGILYRCKSWTIKKAEK